MGRYAKDPSQKARQTKASRQKSAEMPKAETPGDIMRLEKPYWLSNAAAKEWDRIVPMLAEQNMLCGIDADLFGRYCALLADAIRYDRLAAKAESDGVMNARGHFQMSPYVKMADRAWKLAADTASDLGLTPVKRKQLGVTIKAPVTPSELDKNSRRSVINNPRKASDVPHGGIPPRPDWMRNRTT